MSPTPRQIRNQQFNSDNEGVGGWNSLKIWEDQYDKLRQIVDGMNPGALDSGARAYGSMSSAVNETIGLFQSVAGRLVGKWGGQDAQAALDQMNTAYRQAVEIQETSHNISQAMSAHADKQRQWKAAYGSGSEADGWVREVSRWATLPLAAGGPSPLALSSFIANNWNAGDGINQVNEGTAQTNGMFPEGIQEEMPVTNEVQDPLGNSNVNGTPPSGAGIPGGGGPGGGPGDLPGGGAGNPDIPGPGGGPTNPDIPGPGGGPTNPTNPDIPGPTNPPGGGPNGPGSPDFPGGGPNGPGGGSDLAGLGPGGLGGGSGLGGGAGGLPGGGGGLPGGAGGGPGGLPGGAPGGLPGAVGGLPGGRGAGMGGFGRPGAGGIGGTGVPLGAGAGGGQGKQNERERTTWLAEDEDIWTADEGAGPAVIG